MSAITSWDVGHHPNITFNTGDTIKVALTVASSTTGIAVVENLTTGQSHSQSFDVDDDFALCQTDVEWVVFAGEPPPNFGSVTFTDTSAVLSSGGTIGAGDATDIWEIVNSKGLALTATALHPDGSVSISFVQEFSGNS
jgi:hypothetical protein